MQRFLFPEKADCSGSEGVRKFFRLEFDFAMLRQMER